MINQFATEFFAEREEEIQKRWQEKEKRLVKHEQQKQYNSALDPNHMDCDLPDAPQTALSFDPEDMIINI